jgi:hypothetical protein
MLRLRPCLIRIFTNCDIELPLGTGRCGLASFLLSSENRFVYMQCQSKKAASPHCNTHTTRTL